MFGKNSSSIFAHLRPHGGIRPAPRRRSRRVLGLAEIVAGKLEQNWSPEQIAGWLKRTYPDDEAYRVSHETIYRSLFVQARGVLKKELMAHLRSRRALRLSIRTGVSWDREVSVGDVLGGGAHY